MIIYKS